MTQEISAILPDELDRKIAIGWVLAGLAVLCLASPLYNFGRELFDCFNE